MTDNNRASERATHEPSPDGLGQSVGIPDAVELLRDIREDLAASSHDSLADPYIVSELRSLCERAGYGNVMSSASALWRARLGDLAGGEFIAGPCRKTAENIISRIDVMVGDAL